jgi:hypothetical protein
MMSGCRPTNSCASTRSDLGHRRPNERPFARCGHFVQPDSARPCVNAVWRRFCSDRFRRLP